MPIKDPEANRLYWKKYREKHRARILESGKKYRSDPNRRKIAKQRSVDWRRSLSNSVKEYLGGKCSCCNESEFEFLSVDHVNNDGGGMRRRKNHYYYTEISKVFESGLQDQIDKIKLRFSLLCYNCNVSKHFGGGTCVHQRGRGWVATKIGESAVVMRKYTADVKKFLGGVCVCCQEGQPEFLTIDHILHDGYLVSKNANGSRNKYKYLFPIHQSFRNNDLVEIEKIKLRFQLLCNSCNQSKRYGKGICIHKRK